MIYNSKLLINLKTTVETACRNISYLSYQFYDINDVFTFY